MADRVLFMGWKQPVRGAEERAIEALSDTVGVLGRMQQHGRIEGFDVVMLAPNGELGGYFTVRGSADQINAMREDQEFRQATVRATLAVDGISHIEGSTGRRRGSADGDVPAGDRVGSAARLSVRRSGRACRCGTSALNWPIQRARLAAGERPGEVAEWLKALAC